MATNVHTAVVVSSESVEFYVNAFVQLQVSVLCKDVDVVDVDDIVYMSEYVPSYVSRKAINYASPMFSSMYLDMGYTPIVERVVESKDVALVVDHNVSDNFPLFIKGAVIASM